MFYGVVVSVCGSLIQIIPENLKHIVILTTLTNQYLASYKILTGKDETIYNHKCGVT